MEERRTQGRGSKEEMEGQSGVQLEGMACHGEEFRLDSQSQRKPVEILINRGQQ